MKFPPAGLRMSRACRAVIDSSLLFALVALNVTAALWDGMLLQQMIVQHRGNDFGRFYYSARAFLMHQDMYMPNAATSTGNMGAHLLNLNPPHFHLLILPLSRLAFEHALAAWMAASVFAWVLSLLIVSREIGLRPTPRRVLVIVFAGFSFSASQAFFLTGQLSWLLLLPMTVCWRAARRRQWTTAGVLLGACLSIKPFLLIIVPYFVLIRRSRAALAALAAAASAFGVGLPLFGVEPYQAWLRALAQSGDWAWSGMNVSTLGMFQRAFSETPYFTPIPSAARLVALWMVVAAVIAVATLIEAVREGPDGSVDRSLALLLVGSQLVAPLGWVYYLWLPAGPIAALMTTSRRFVTRFPWALRVLAVIAALGLIAPLTVVYAGRTGWAALTLGSVYFWATLALWTCLVLATADHINRPPGRADKTGEPVHVG